MSAKLIIDLQKYQDCEKSTIKCSYKHHPENQGLDELLEKVRFALICRKCKAAPCINACPQEALEKVAIDGSDEGILTRAKMLCTGCGTCSLACPFGTVYPDLIGFVTSICDLCKGRLESNEKPLCVTTCPCDALDYKEVQVGGDLVEVLDGVVVKVAGGTVWEPFLKAKVKR